LIVVTLFKVVYFQVYATGPAFLPLLEALLELTSWNDTYDHQLLFQGYLKPNFPHILIEKTTLKAVFCPYHH
jgi:hypothetical protein